MLTKRVLQAVDSSIRHWLRVTVAHCSELRESGVRVLEALTHGL